MNFKVDTIDGKIRLTVDDGALWEIYMDRDEAGNLASCLVTVLSDMIEDQSAESESSGQADSREST